MPDGEIVRLGLVNVKWEESDGMRKLSNYVRKQLRNYIHYKKTF